MATPSTYEMIAKDTLHVNFLCLKFAVYRADVETVARILPASKNIVDTKLTSEITWNAVEKLRKVMHDVFRKEKFSKKVMNSKTTK